MLNRHFCLLITGCTWAVMVYFLFEKEILPYFEYQTPPSYKTMLRDQKKAVVRYYSVSLGAQRVGEAETLTRPLPGGGHFMETRMVMKAGSFVQIKLVDDLVQIKNEVRVDADFRLTEFMLTGRMSGIPIKVQGTRQDDQLHVRYRFLQFHDDQLFDFPDDATLSNEFFPFQGGAMLTVGKKWKMKMIDAGSLISLNKKNRLALKEVYATVVGREVVEIGEEKSVEAFLVEVRRKHQEEIPSYRVWVDDRGTVVRQRSTFRKLENDIRLVEEREMSAEEAAAHTWRIKPTRIK